jgi:hypothetical protein
VRWPKRFVTPDASMTASSDRGAPAGCNVIRLLTV